MSRDAATLRPAALLSYGGLALPLAFAGMPLYVHAPDYYAVEQGVSLASIGMVLLVLRFIDAVQDPWIGQLSDRYRHRRFLIILFASIALVLGFLGLFQPMGAAPLVWFAVMLFVATTAFSVLSININTLGGLWSDQYHQKTRITTYREAFGLIGLLLAVMLPSVLQQFMPASHAFLIAAAVLAVLMGLFMGIFARWFGEYAGNSTIKTDTEKGGFRQLLQRLTRPQRRFFLIYAVSMLASALPAVLVLFFIRDLLQAEAYTGLFLALYFLAGVAAMPFWQYVSRRSGKPQAWLLAMCLAVAVFIWAFALGPGDIWQFGVICLLSGSALGADIALPPSMLADYVQEQGQEGQASRQFALLTFLAKFGLAVASILVLPALDGLGFQPGGQNSASALLGLSVAYALLPSVIKLIAAGMLWRLIRVSLNQGGEYAPSHHTHSIRSHPHA